MNNLNIGKAGEYRIISELLLRGHLPCLSIVDNGIDIILENGKTIQARTISKGSLTDKDAYTCPLTTAKYVKDKQVKCFEKKSDFYIFWLLDIDKFYIIPKIDLVNTSCIALRPKSNASKYSKYYENWNQLKK